MVAAADSVFLAVAVKVAGIHSPRNSSRDHSAGRLYPPPRTGGGQAECVVGTATCTALGGHAGGSAGRAVQAAKAGSSEKCDHRRGGAWRYSHSCSLVESAHARL